MAEYLDSGCRYYTACLSCPLSKCAYDSHPQNVIKELIKLGLPVPKAEKKRHGHYYVKVKGYSELT